MLRAVVVVACSRIVDEQAKPHVTAHGLNLVTLLYRGMGSELQLFQSNIIVTSEASEQVSQLARDIGYKFGSAVCWMQLMSKAS